MIPDYSLVCPICDGNDAKSWHVCDECSVLTCDYCTNNVDWNEDEEEFDKIICDTCYKMDKFHPTPVEHVGPKTITLTGLSSGDPVPGIWMEIDFKQTNINLANATIPQFEDWYQAPTVSAIYAKEMMQQWEALEEASHVRKAADELLCNLYKTHGPKGAFWVETAKKELLDATRCNLCFYPSKHAIDHPRGLCYPCSTR